MTAFCIPKFEEMHSNAELVKRGDKPWFWVRFPTSLDSLTLRRLMKSHDGMMALGAYMVLVEIAAKTPPRGVLTHRGSAMTVADICDLTGMPPDALKAAIELLESEDIGWLQQIDGLELIPMQSVCDPDPIDQNGTSNSLLLNPESSGGGVGGVCADFEQFWRAYPSPKSKKPAARRAWDAADLPPIEAILRKLAELKRSQRWRAEGGKYIPSPAKWIAEEGWSDEAEGANRATDPAEEVRKAEARRRQADADRASNLSTEERRQIIADAKKGGA